jgi:hypothetical protein
VTDAQHIAFIKILEHIPNVEALYEEDDGYGLEEKVCMQYENFDVCITAYGDAYLTQVGSIRPIRIYDALNGIVKPSGLDVDVIENLACSLLGAHFV